MFRATRGRGRGRTFGSGPRGAEKDTQKWSDKIERRRQKKRRNQGEKEPEGGRSDSESNDFFYSQRPKGTSNKLAAPSSRPLPLRPPTFLFSFSYFPNPPPHTHTHTGHFYFKEITDDLVLKFGKNFTTIPMKRQRLQRRSADALDRRCNGTITRSNRRGNPVKKNNKLGNNALKCSKKKNNSSSGHWPLGNKNRCRSGTSTEKEE